MWKSWSSWETGLSTGGSRTLASESLGELLKIQMAAFLIWQVWAGPEILHFQQVPGNADIAGPGTPL